MPTQNGPRLTRKDIPELDYMSAPIRSLAENRRDGAAIRADDRLPPRTPQFCPQLVHGGIPEFHLITFLLSYGHDLVRSIQAQQDAAVLQREAENVHELTGVVSQGAQLLARGHVPQVGLLPISRGHDLPVHTQENRAKGLRFEG